MKKISLLVVAVMAFGFFGCSLKSKLPSPMESLDRVPDPSPESVKQREIPLDLDRLQLEMGIERSAETLGFYQKRVNPCDYHIPGAEGAVCGKKYFTWIHFRILCRSTDGTVDSVNKWEFEPLDGNLISYSVGRWKGQLRTDEEGFGQIRVLSTPSLRNKRLILKNKVNALGLAAGSVKKIVVPQAWCRER